MYNVIVAGSTDFTTDCILQLMKMDNVNISSVIAPIDSKKDRKRNIIISEVSKIALENNINFVRFEARFFNRCSLWKNFIEKNFGDS